MFLWFRHKWLKRGRSTLNSLNNPKPAINRTTMGEDVVKSFYDDIALKYDSRLLWKENRRLNDRGSQWGISSDVFHRMILRHNALQRAIEREKDTDIYRHLRNLVSDPTTRGDRSPIEAESRAYKLATTDLFVEKAIRNLEIDSDDYTRRGKTAFYWSWVVIIIGIVISAYIVVPDQKIENIVKLLNGIFSTASSAPAGTGTGTGTVNTQNEGSRPAKAGSSTGTAETGTSNVGTGTTNPVPAATSTDSLSVTVNGGDAVAITRNSTGGPVHTEADLWIGFAKTFTGTFTFFGFLVLLVVAQWRYGRAMMDQAERLRQKRHALRQGRLFIHLRDGNATVDELEKAFSWNLMTGNAFGNIPTEASAPWGGIFKDAIKAVTERFKATKDSG